MRTRRILLIDDTPANRYVLRKILLTETGYEVMEAGSGAEGLEKLDSSVDLVILDINLPDMTGFELIQQAGEKMGAGRLPAIINISATFMSGKDKAMGLNSGAQAYLTHPINPDEMLATISSLLKSSGHLQRIEKQRNLAQARSENLQAERIMLERFMRSFGHDLRSPLSAAVMVSGLMQKSPGRRSDELLKVLSENLKRMDDMITDVLNISHASMGGGIKLNGEKLQLDGLLNEAIDNLRYLVTQPLTLDADTKGQQVFWDRQAFLRIVDNLVLNAARHGEQGTPIAVQLYLDGQFAILKVSNRGVMPDEVLENLATPYFISSRSETRGWGLGLPIVKLLCETFGGDVEFSNRGSQVLVEVRLPLRLQDQSTI
ncbi:ATP-binding response regulator [Stutzerimonas tarimensis]|uniref:histidine kinase n=1 Tax=Stutzerimonas tarimensis TaxID=1507735 RepID=A0ABV7T4T8_9GAMM